MLVNSLSKAAPLLMGQVLLLLEVPWPCDTRGWFCPQPCSVRPLPLLPKPVAASNGQWQWHEHGEGEPAPTASNRLQWVKAVPAPWKRPAPARVQRQVGLQSERYTDVLNTCVRKNIIHLWNSEVPYFMDTSLTTYTEVAQAFITCYIWWSELCKKPIELHHKIMHLFWRTPEVRKKA